MLIVLMTQSGVKSKCVWIFGNKPPSALRTTTRASKSSAACWRIQSARREASQSPTLSSHVGYHSSQTKLSSDVWNSVTPHVLLLMSFHSARNSSSRKPEDHHSTHRVHLSAGSCASAGFNSQMESRSEPLGAFYHTLYASICDWQMTFLSFSVFLPGMWFFQEGKNTFKEPNSSMFNNLMVIFII